MKGYHKGVLAGLPEKEREDAINAEMEKIRPKGVSKSIIDFLKNQAIKGPVTSDLEKLLYKEPKEYLKRWAMVLGAEVAGRSTKADLVKAIAPRIRNNPFPVEIVLRGGLNLDQFDSYRKLYESGGEFEIQEDKIKTLRGIPAAERIICYSFYIKEKNEKSGKFTFVIPDDIMDILAGLDWEDIRGQIKSYEAAADVADAIAELRGMAKIDEIYNEFCRFHPTALSRQEFDDAVAGAINDERIGCVWLEADDGEDYLLYYDLADYCREEAGEVEDLDRDDTFGFDDSFIQGGFEVLEYIDKERRSKKPRPLEKGMLSSEAVFDWKSKRPAALALRAYLDEHVPDSQSDYFYADAVIEDIIEYMMPGFMTGSEMVEDWLSILENHDYTPGNAELRRVIGLLMNVYNSIPTWLNNGWAPDELSDNGI